MSLLGTLAAIGAGAAGVKVFERMKENNPEGFTSYAKEAEVAAKQLFSENAPVVKEKAQEKIEELKAKFPGAVNQIEGIVNDVKASVKSAVSAPEDPAEVIVEEEKKEEE